jgi:hypothetical protein
MAYFFAAVRVADRLPALKPWLKRYSSDELSVNWLVTVVASPCRPGVAAGFRNRYAEAPSPDHDPLKRNYHSLDVFARSI